MRLFLSSYGFGEEPQKLVTLVGNNKRVSIISNATDYHTDTEVAERNEREVASLVDLGFEPEVLDLKKYFNNQSGLLKALGSSGLVWVRGGNSFILQRAINASRFDRVIKDLLARDQIVYGGYSAGSVVASPDLRGIDIVDNPNIVPAGYVADIPWQGMGLIDYAIAPHYRSNHPESDAVERTVAYYENNGMAYKALSDGQVIIVDGSRSSVIG